MKPQQPRFTYEEFWALEEQTLPPYQAHPQHATIDRTELPVDVTLTPYHAALKHITSLYNLNELQSEGFDVETMLMYKTESDILYELEEAGMELTISLREIERQIHVEEHRQLLSVPIPKTTSFYIRPAGLDESAPFESIDFERQFGSFTFNKKRYAQKKAAEKLALLNNCASEGRDKESIKVQITSIPIGDCKERARRASAALRQTTDEIRRTAAA